MTPPPEANLVTLNVDGRDVSVPAGTGLVEAAAELGVEIPVFCYEPRLGPPVGACRMCLVEIEGVPKLQAACATSVREGMVVSTVSDRAREAQEAVLEFLLVNHPLDCPVCDKGGECPLQDHAFRWGPGASRFSEIKRVNDKPIPISPLIALDRERCILCYRCTRFSAEVSQDDQLVARQRGASSVIATFEGRPYDAHHSGNVIELCPVGALTSTEFRFRARPWEAPDHPGIAHWDPCGTNVYNTVREGRVVRVLSRRNDAVDNGWIDDRTRFSYTSMYGPERILRPRQRPHRERPIGNRPVVEASWEVALEWLHDRLVQADDETLWVLSGNETLEVAHAVQQVAAASGGRVVAAPGGSGAAPEATTTIAALEAARHVLVLGDADLLDVAPQLDLRVRAAIRAGAMVTVAGAGGTRIEQGGATHHHVAPGQLDDWIGAFCTGMREALAGTTPTEPGIVVYRDGEVGAAALADLAATFALPRAGSGFLAIPDSANARGLAALHVLPVTWEEILGHEGSVVFFGVDPDRAVDISQWGPAHKRWSWVASVDTLPTPAHEATDLVLPGAFAAEQEGTLVNLEGRVQRLTMGAEPPAGIRLPLRWLAGLARRLSAGAGASAVPVPSHAAGTFRQLAVAHGDRLPAATHGEIGEHGVLGVVGGPEPLARVVAPVERSRDELAVYVAPFLYDAPDVAHAEPMAFLRERAQVVLHRDDAASRGLARGDAAVLELDGRELSVTVATSTRVAPGHARIHAGTAGLPAGRSGWRAGQVRRATADTRPAATDTGHATTDMSAAATPTTTGEGA